MSLERFKTTIDFSLLAGCFGRRGGLGVKVLERLGINKSAAEKFLDWLDRLCQKIPKKTIPADRVDARIRKDPSIDNATAIKLKVLLADLNRLEEVRNNPSKIQSGSFSDIHGQLWDIASESFMGSSRGFSTNSDTTTDIYHAINIQGEEHSLLMAAIADGVSGFDLDKKWSSGKMASRTVIRYLDENQQDFSKPVDLILTKPEPNEDTGNLTLERYLSRGISQLTQRLKIEKPAGDDELKQAEQLYRALTTNINQILLPGLKKDMSLLNAYLVLHNAKITKSGFEKIDPSQEFQKGFDPSKYIRSKLSPLKLTLGLVDMGALKESAHKFFSDLDQHSILGNLLIDKAPLAINAITLLDRATDQIAEKMNRQRASYGSDYEALHPGTTLTMTLDAGDKIMLVSVGDPVAFAYKDGRILQETINKPHIILNPHTNSPAVYSVVGAQYNGRRNLTVGEKDFSVCIRLVDKNSIDGIFLSSDGIVANPINQALATKAAFQAFERDVFSEADSTVQELLAKALDSAVNQEHPGDDKSVTLIQKKK